MSAGSNKVPKAEQPPHSTTKTVIAIAILIDTREQKGEYIQSRFDMLGVQSSIGTLPEQTGCDYLISGLHGSCCIQRKDSTAELINQMDELAHDILPRLCNFADEISSTPVLLVEESHIFGKLGYIFRKQNGAWIETGLPAASYYGFLETCRMNGIEVVATRNLDASICYMASMDGYFSRYHYPRRAKTFRIPQQAVGMLACIPGIAEKRAKKALACQSIAGMCQGRFDGFTKAQAEKVRRVLEWQG